MKGPAESYVRLLDDVAIKRDQEAQSRPPYPLRPSSAGECSRKLAHQLNAYLGNEEFAVENRRASVVRLLSLGHSIEWALIKDMKEMENFSVRFEQQVVEMFRLNSGRIIEGSTDCVLWNEQHKCLLDVKSVGDRYDKAFASKWDAMVEEYDSCENTQRIGEEDAWWVEDTEAFIKELDKGDTLVKNIYQINLYACTEFLQKRGIDHAVVMRYCKNNSRLMEIRFKPSMALFTAIEKKYNLVEKAALNKDPTQVPKDYALGSMACAYCPYQAKCWPGATKREIFAGAPKKNWARKAHELENGEEVEGLFNSYREAGKSADLQKRIEQSILVALDRTDTNKVKLAEGEVYEVVTLKSPKPHQVLRRSKE